MKVLIVFLFILTFRSFSYEMGVDLKALGNQENIQKLISNLKKSYKEIGIEIEVKDIPLARSFELIRLNKLDSEIGRFASVVKRNSLNHVPVPISRSKVCAFNDGRTDKPFANARVSTMASGRLVERLNIKEILKSDKAINAVRLYKQRKNIDYVIGFDFVYFPIFEQEKLKMKCVHTITVENVYHVVSDKNKHLIPKLIPAFKKYFKLIAVE